MPTVTAPKLVSMQVDETSGVDHPAHLVEGFMLMKAKGDGAGKLFEQFRAAGSTGSQGGTMPAADEMTLEKAKELLKAAEVADAEKLAKAAALEAEVAELRKELETLKAAGTAGAPAEVDPFAGLDLPEAVRTELTKARDRQNAETAELKTQVTAATEALAKAAVERETEQELAKARGREYLAVDFTVLAKSMQAIRSISPELAAPIDQALDAANEQMKTAGLLKAVGTSGSTSDAGNALATIQVLAKAKYDAGQAKTMPEAIALVMQDPENRGLYAQSEQEGN